MFLCPVKSMKKYLHSDLTEKIIGSCLEVHKALGPGFPENAYHNALKLIFLKKKLNFESEKEFKVEFLNETVGIYRIDFVVDSRVVVEIKAVTGKLPDVFKAQVIAYLKASGFEVGLLVNFGNEKLNVRRLARYKDYKKQL